MTCLFTILTVKSGVRNKPAGQLPADLYHGSMNFRRRAVSPDSSGLKDVNVIEVRPGRWLRIQHLQPGGKSTHSDTDSQSDTPSSRTQNGQVEMQVSAAVNSKDVELTSDSTLQIITNSNPPSGKECTVDASLPQSNSLAGHSETNSPLSQDELEESCSSVTYSKLVHHAYQTPRRTSNVTAAAAMQKRRGSKWSSQVSLISLMEEPGTVLFFLHGVGGCGEVWHHQIDYFCRAGFEMVIPDMLGHGFSRAPRQTSAYTFEELADDMLSVFDRYAKKRNVLIGHSYG